MTKTLSAIRTAVVTHYVEPPTGSTTVCTDELGKVDSAHVCTSTWPVLQWPPIPAFLEYSRGEEKVWIYGALRVRDGKEITRCAAARNLKNSIELRKRH